MPVFNKPQRTEKRPGDQDGPWCNFCANKGKPARSCASHYASDCRDLANTQCEGCGNRGHTVSRCPRSSSAGGGHRSDADSVSSHEFRGCGHCRNLGKPEHIFMSHAAKDCRYMSCLRCGCRGHTESRCTAQTAQNEEVDEEQEEQEEQEDIVESDFPSLPVVQENTTPVAASTEISAPVAASAEISAPVAASAEISAPVAASAEEPANTQVEERQVMETTVRDLQARVAALEEELAAIRGIFGGLSAKR